MVLDRDIVVSVSKGKYLYKKGDEVIILGPTVYKDTWQITLTCMTRASSYTYIQYDTEDEAIKAYERLTYLLNTTNIDKIHQDTLISASFEPEVTKKKPSQTSGETKMLMSYISAITKCGGAVDSFIEDIDTMTVAEMINILGPNNVRFVYKD